MRVIFAQIQVFQSVPKRSKVFQMAFRSVPLKIWNTGMKPIVITYTSFDKASLILGMVC
jgi:hypothetical protein